MPLVRIDLRAGKSTDYRRAIGDQVHRALVETITIPPLDRFQVIAEHPAEGLIYDPTYLDIERTDDVIFIQIALSAGHRRAEARAVRADRGATGGRSGGAAARCADQPGRGRA